MGELRYRDFVVHALEQHFTLKQNDLGADAHRKKKGAKFTTETWEIEGVGHLCVLRMKAAFGLIRMETAVIAPTQVDMPLFNIDWLSVFGFELQMIELYDTQLQPWPAEYSAVFDRLLARDADLDNMKQQEEARWYDSILYPCSYHKQGKGISGRFTESAHDYLVAFIDQLADAPACDGREKQAKVRDFATRLYEADGPAVAPVKKLFGDEIAKRIVVQHMYGVNESSATNAPGEAAHA